MSKLQLMVSISKIMEIRICGKKRIKCIGIYKKVKERK